MRDDKVVDFRQWYTVDELAEREGVSTRTIYRRLERGDVEKRETPEGTRYRPTTGEESTDTSGVSGDSHDTGTDVSGVSAPRGEGVSGDVTSVSSGVSTDSSGVTDNGALADLLREHTDRIAELEREVGRLRERNANLRSELDALRGGDDGAVTQSSEQQATDDGNSKAAELVDALRETADTDDE